MNAKIDRIANWFETDDIRNISIISHVDHGKTTLSDHFIAAGGILPKHLAGHLRALDDLPEEQKRGITIEMSYTSIILNYDKKQFLVNLIDTPGHVDFSGKVAESLRLVDGAFILVDAVEGIMAQTKTVLNQAIREKVQLILFINKIDRLITELELNTDKIQERIERIIGEIHSLFIKSEIEKKYYPNFSNGTIILGSALDGWAIDNEFAKSGGRISQIVDYYKNGKTEDLMILSPLINTFSRIFAQSMPSPKTGQKIKFPDLFVTSPTDEILSKIYACNSEDNLILLVGRSHRIQATSQVSYIVRLLSGTIKRGMTINTRHSESKIRIIKIFQIMGKTVKDVKEVRAGQIAGIVVSIPLIPGEMLTSADITVPEITNISYVQDAVVAVSIEPLEVKDIGKLESSIEKICEVTPGLEYEINKDTGELVAMGVGTLQLEILKSELESKKLKLNVSAPKVLKYEMPTKLNDFVIEKWGQISGFAGMTNSIEEDIQPLFSDSQNNQLITKFQMNKDVEDGITEVFRQFMRVSPLNGERIRNFTITIESFPDTKKLNTYENGIIIGSSIIKTALTITETQLHEPYYQIEINIPEQYLGSVLQELYKLEIIIENVESSKMESVVEGKILVQVAPKLADRLRQITDGNVFWSFSSVSFQPILNQNF
ncbi:MAG: GTP-binding protein [Candidatus Kariarchaeaceae archaeon]|jgi:elongation factor 2